MALSLASCANADAAFSRLAALHSFVSPSVASTPTGAFIQTAASTQLVHAGIAVADCEQAVTASKLREQCTAAEALAAAAIQRADALARVNEELAAALRVAEERAAEWKVSSDRATAACEELKREWLGTIKRSMRLEEQRDRLRCFIRTAGSNLVQRRSLHNACQTRAASANSERSPWSMPLQPNLPIQLTISKCGGGGVKLETKAREEKPLASLKPMGVDVDEQVSRQGKTRGGSPSSRTAL